jgi:pimeloyl-ACP methyl ester carboxylesterase
MSSPSGSPPIPDVPGLTHRHVDVGGTRLHVAEGGSGPPVLLLHGWPQHWYAWRGVAPLLATDHRVICPDLRGHGWSDAPPGRYDKQTLADDMLALLDALELDRVDLIGHDWGAWAAFLLCLDHPDRIGHYLGLNIVTPWPNRTSPRAVLGLWRLWYQVLLGSPGLGGLVLRRTGFVRKAITAGAVHPEAWDEQDIEHFAAVLREPARARMSQRLYRTFLLRELLPYASGRHRGRRLTVPTLLLHGTRDPVIDHRRLGDWEQWADEMAVEFREDSGHFIAEELPEVVAARARALFAGQRPADLAAQR